jgi:hypothetical protein
MDLWRLALRLVVQETGQVIPEEIIVNPFEEACFPFRQGLA